MIIEFEGYQINGKTEKNDRGDDHCNSTVENNGFAGDDIFSAVDRGILVHGKKRSREEIAGIFHHLFEKFPLLTEQEIITRFMLLYDYQLVPENHLGVEADMVVDMDIHRVIEPWNEWSDDDEAAY